LSPKTNVFNVSEPKAGMVYMFQLKDPEVMMHLKCDVHSGMSSYIGVVTNPYYAVSGSDGTFKITGVPAGKQTVQIWHERYGPLMQSVDVQAGKTATVDFMYTGTEKPAAAAGLRVREITIPTATF
jgi:hypothetical protein